MASQRITRADLYPDGTTVTAYPASNWSQAARPPSGAPVGSSEGTAGVMASGAATLTGLTEDRDFFAYGLVGGEHRYVSFKADTVSTADRALDRDNGQAGILAPSWVAWNTGGLVAVANTAVLARFVPSRDMTIVSLAFAISAAATANDECDVGIYDAALQRLVSKGTTAGLLNATTGVKVATITPFTLRAGTVYYAAHSVGAIGGTPATIRGASSDVNLAALFGATAGLAEAMSKTASHPLPASLVGATVTAMPAALALREV